MAFFRCRDVGRAASDDELSDDMDADHGGEIESGNESEDKNDVVDEFAAEAARLMEALGSDDSSSDGGEFIGLEHGFTYFLLPYVK